MLQRSEETVKELREITIKTDTRDILSHATIQAEALEDYFLVDIDAHVTETQFWPEILDLIDNDVIRHMGHAVASRPVTSTALLNAQPGTLSWEITKSSLRANATRWRNWSLPVIAACHHSDCIHSAASPQ